MFPRDRQPELMDDPKLPEQEHRRALAGLSRLNRLSLAAGAMYRELRPFAMSSDRGPLSVLDVASGAGDVPLAWARRARRDGWKLQLTLLDGSAVAVEEQKRRAKAMGVDILSLHQDCLKSPLPGGFDVVTCSLFMHHLDDHQAFCLLQSMQSAATRGILISDLERTKFNLAVVQIAARLVTRSPVVHTDAALSVRAAYTMDEFEKLARSALARPIRIRRSFPCRFIAKMAEETVTETVPELAFQGTT